MKRAFSILTAKAVGDDDERVIEGIASTPSTDRMGDVVEPMGAKFALPLPLLWQHRHDEPVGMVEFAEPNERGIPFKARLAQIAEPGPLKDLVDKAWQSVKAGLVRGVSIGFAAKDYEALPEGGMRFKEWSWLELSLVTIPANAEATISAIKSISQEQMAASGQREKTPGVSGNPVKLKSKGTETMSLADQIASLEAKRAANAAQMEAILTKSADAGETTSAADQEEFDALSAEVEQIDADIKRFRALERVKMAAAKPVTGTKSVDGSEARNPSIPAQIRVNEKLDKGVGFARLAKVKALAKLDGESPREIAKSLYSENSSVYGLLSKAAVAAGTTTNPTWAGALVGDETSVFADFVEFLRPMTIMGRFGTNGIPSLRRVPFRTALIGQSSGGSGYWVGEGKGKPLTKFDFTRTTLDPLKVANIAVVTEEVLRDSSPSAELIVRDQLAAALRERMDIDFIDPAKAAASGVSPASILNGVTGLPSAGSNADAVRADIQALFGAFIAANNAPTSGVWIMPATVALSLSLMMNPLGQPEFPGITMMGGTLFGLPVIVSEYVPTGANGAIVALVNASDIYMGDEGGISVDMSREASLQMADNPTIDATNGTGASLVSLWQANAVGFRAERTINWARRRPSAVAYLEDVTWGALEASGA